MFSERQCRERALRARRLAWVSVRGTEMGFGEFLGGLAATMRRSGFQHGVVSGEYDLRVTGGLSDAPSWMPMLQEFSRFVCRT